MFLNVVPDGCIEHRHRLRFVLYSACRNMRKQKTPCVPIVTNLSLYSLGSFAGLSFCIR
jgi:hypothetical protein